MTTALGLALAFGQLLALILAINTSHGLGANSRWIDRVVLGLIAAFGMVGVAVVYRVWGLPPSEWPLAIQVYSAPCLFLAIVGLPGATILRWMRPVVREARLVGSRTVDLRVEANGPALVGAGLRGWVLSLPFNDALKVRSADWSVTVGGLPPALDGLTILHVTDLHFAPAYGREFFERAIKIASESGPEPDLVMITGDFIDDDSALSWVGPVLGILRGRLGQFAILGNHDYRHDFRGLRRELRGSGFKVLEGRWTSVDVQDSKLAIGGTTAPWGKDLFRRAAPEADVRLVMSHSPDQVYRAALQGVDLMLCGHNHGGQVRLPVVGPVLMPSRYSRRFDRGFFRVGRTLMYVGQGLGAKDPLRIGCPPEMTRLTLRATAATVDGPSEARTLAGVASEATDD